MRRFLGRLFFLSVPFLLYGAAVVVIDPFRLINLVTFVPTEIKRASAEPNNYALWGVCDFKNDPRPAVLLGDSKVANLSTADIEKASGITYKNLGLGGGSAIEVVNLFWFTTRRVQLQDVCISLGFDNFNQFMSRDRVRASESVLSNWLMYFSSRDVATSTWYLLKWKLTGAKPRIGRVGGDKDAFWKEYLTYGAPRRLISFKFDEDSFSKIKDIATYCRDHHIRLRFVILPSHEDFQRKILEFGLEKEWKSFPDRLRALGETWDFDVQNAENSNRDNFKDCLHTTPEYGREIINRVWGSPSASPRRE